ncbi:MAG TPA: superoxide dismutase family protein, partial [Gemmatimonadaceae bacterium]|nr:superoxide dismutase family protein [Gemmatimonadaceae bacterium]
MTPAPTPAPRARRLARLAALALGAASAGACATARPSLPPAIASATFHTADGREVGTATLRQVDNAIQVDLDVRGIPDGTHGLHFHTAGKCDPPDFASAGGHLNPGG